MAREHHFCGVSEAQAFRAGPWRKREITWRWAGDLPGLSLADCRGAAAEAFASWQAVCGLTFREVQGAAADITMTTGPIDGPGQVLAWSHLSDGQDRPLLQKYDDGERFVIAVRPPRDRIDLVAVACHEVGHAIGFEHAARDSGDLMAPTYKPGLRTPQQGDQARARAWYGPPLPQPGPAPPGVEPAVVTIFDAAGRVLASYKLGERIA